MASPTIVPDFDTTHVVKLAADLLRSPAITATRAQTVIAASALSVQTEARRIIGTSEMLPYYAASITHDLSSGLLSWEAEIGPDKNLPQGPLGNILEYGTSRTAPIPHLGPALLAEESKYVAAMGQTMDDL